MSPRTKPWLSTARTPPKLTADICDFAGQGAKGDINGYINDGRAGRKFAVLLSFCRLHHDMAVEGDFSPITFFTFVFTNAKLSAIMGVPNKT